IAVGEIVFIGSDNLKRIDWPLAVVEGILPNKEGDARLARLRTAVGYVLRPIQRIYALELRVSTEVVSNEETVEETVEEEGLTEKETRSGRKVIVLKKLDL